MKLFLAIWRYAFVAVIALCLGLLIQKNFLILNDDTKLSDEELQTTLNALTKQVERLTTSNSNSEMQDVQKVLEGMVKQIDSKTQN